jgi:hypothetical protein
MTSHENKQTNKQTIRDILFTVVDADDDDGTCAATTWTGQTAAADIFWSSVTLGNNLFVAVAESGSGDHVMTSHDGMAWTGQTAAAANAWTSVTFGNGLFVAVTASGNEDFVMTSSWEYAHPTQ